MEALEIGMQTNLSRIESVGSDCVIVRFICDCDWLHAERQQKGEKGPNNPQLLPEDIPFREDRFVNYFVLSMISPPNRIKERGDCGFHIHVIGIRSNKRRAQP